LAGNETYSERNYSEKVRKKQGKNLSKKKPYGRPKSQK